MTDDAPAIVRRTTIPVAELDDARVRASFEANGATGAILAELNDGYVVRWPLLNGAEPTDETLLEAAANQRAFFAADAGATELEPADDDQA